MADTTHTKKYLIVGVAGDGSKRADALTSEEIAIRNSQMEGIVGALRASEPEGTTYNIRAEMIKFSSGGLETAKSQAGDDETLVVVLMCHSMNADGTPASADTYKPEHALKLAHGLHGHFKPGFEKFCIVAACPGGLDFRNEMLRLLPTDWHVHNSAPGPVAAVRDGDGWVLEFAEKEIARLSERHCDVGLGHKQ